MMPPPPKVCPLLLDVPLVELVPEVVLPNAEPVELVELAVPLASVPDVVEVEPVRDELPPSRLLAPVMLLVLPPLTPVPARVAPDNAMGWPKKPKAMGVLFSPKRMGRQSSLPVIGSV